MDRYCCICSQPIPASKAWSAMTCGAKCQREYYKIKARERRQQLRKDGTSQWQLRTSHWSQAQWERFRLSKRLESGRDRSKEYQAKRGKLRVLMSGHGTCTCSAVVV
jgi:hypothetical protein